MLHLQPPDSAEESCDYLTSEVILIIYLQEPVMLYAGFILVH